MDPGTAYEVGYMRAMGKLAFLYSNAPGAYADRVASAHDAAGRLADGQGLLVEDFGLTENLMLACAAEAVFLPDAAPADPWRDYETFTRAAWAAAQKSKSA